MSKSDRPQRPRSHQLEDESRRAFEAALPKEWVFRTANHDYGVDGEVEIFDEMGGATGVRFLVQLKATDAPMSGKGPSVRLKTSTINYYRSLRLPVLLCLYVAADSKIFVAWFHSLDPYYGKRSGDGRTWTMPMPVDAVWCSDTPQKLQEGVNAFLEVRSTTLSPRVTFSIQCPDALWGSDCSHLVDEVNEIIRRCPGRVSFRADSLAASRPSFSVRVVEDELSVRVGGMSGVALHFPEGRDRSYVRDGLAQDVVAAVGLALHWHGHSLVASDLIEACWVSSRLLHDPEAAIAAGLCLVSANRFVAATKLMQAFSSRVETFGAGQAVLVALLEARSRATEVEAEFLARTLEDLAGTFAARGEPVLAATSYYNAANVYGQLDRLVRAARNYRRARTQDAAYVLRPYFWDERAGVLFRSQKYSAAAAAYARGLAIEQCVRRRLLYADALLFAGRIEEARAQFEEALNAADEGQDSEWWLKRALCNLIIEKLGVTLSARQPPVFPSDFKPSSMRDEEIEAVCREALGMDVLAPLAWFNLGGVWERAGDNESAALAWVACGLVVPTDATAWANAFVASMQCKEAELAAAVLAAGARNGRVALLDALRPMLPGDAGAEWLRELQTRLRDLVPTEPISRAGVVRVVREDGFDIVIPRLGGNYN